MFAIRLMYIYFENVRAAYPQGGQTMSFNPISSPPPPSAYGTVTSQAVKQGTSAKETVNIDIEEGENSEANRAVKKRYWTHEEEERLVITYQFF